MIGAHCSGRLAMKMCQVENEIQIVEIIFSDEKVIHRGQQSRQTAAHAFYIVFHNLKYIFDMSVLFSSLLYYNNMISQWSRVQYSSRFIF